MNAILEDLTTLPTKRLEKRLEELARDAFPCHAATVFDGNPVEGLTVALHVDSQNRGDVLDLARVVEDDAAVHVRVDGRSLPRTDAILIGGYSSA